MHAVLFERECFSITVRCILNTESIASFFFGLPSARNVLLLQAMGFTLRDRWVWHLPSSVSARFIVPIPIMPTERGAARPYKR